MKRYWSSCSRPSRSPRNRSAAHQTQILRNARHASRGVDPGRESVHRTYTVMPIGAGRHGRDGVIRCCRSGASPTADWAMRLEIDQKARRECWTIRPVGGRRTWLLDASTLGVGPAAGNIRPTCGVLWKADAKSAACLPSDLSLVVLIVDALLSWFRVRPVPPSRPCTLDWHPLPNRCWLVSAG
jgi:hypothetical protein